MSEELQNWACAELDSLGLPDAAVIIRYLEPLESPGDVKDYLSSMLDMRQPKHKEFVAEFLDRQAKSKVDKRFYRKTDYNEESLGLQGKKKGKDKNVSHSGAGNGSGKGSRNGSNNDKENQSEHRRGSPLTVGNDSTLKSNNQGKKKPKETDTKRSTSPPSLESLQIQPAETHGKKKTKFVNLYSSDGMNPDVVMLSGRNPCQCMASKHKLVNNCLSCGRIVCEQEGAGPCFFCGTVVQTKQERDGTAVPTKVVATPTQPTKGKNVTVKDVAADIQRAVDHKNLLLEYDRTSEKRTRVLDDESDYFDSNSRWISKSDREKLQAREIELKAQKYDKLSSTNITIDLLGRRIVAEETNHAGVYDPDDPVLKAILERKPDDIFNACEKNNMKPPQALKPPVYVDNRNKVVDVDRPLSFPMGTGNDMSRLQDGDLQVMCDQGKCLSMHQPWASLLIAGIKPHEGRTWYSAHRGRLWIASAAKVPEPEEIERIESLCPKPANGQDLVFPTHYPPACLLGCVDVADVLPQEEYRVQYPDGDSDSPYVFICRYPREMIFKFPIKGQHKIFALDSKIHKAARLALK